MKSRNRSVLFPPIELSWHDAGSLHRVTCWPDVRFERETEAGWIPEDPDEDTYFAASSCLGCASWLQYLENFPAEIRTFLLRLGPGRIAGLNVIAHCPELGPLLSEVPALSAFLAHHASLRGTPSMRWGEISAVYERSQAYGLLEWLGLPASRQTLHILGKLSHPDIPSRLLEPFRTLLWEPMAIFRLQHAEQITERELVDSCQAHAA